MEGNSVVGYLMYSNWASPGRVEVCVRVMRLRL